LTVTEGYQQWCVN